MEASGSERGPWTALLENLGDNDAPVALPGASMADGSSQYSYVRVAVFARGDVAGASSAAAALPARAAKPQRETAVSL